MTKSSQKRVKIIYLFCNLHTLKCKEKHPPVGRGGSGREPEQHVRPQPPVGGEASSHAPERRATPAPGGQGELRLRARPARATPAPSGQGGSGRASELPVDV